MKEAIREDLVVRGTVISKISEFKYLVQIERCKFKGDVSSKNYFEELTVGKSITAKIVKLQQEKMKIKLQNLTG